MEGCHELLPNLRVSKIVPTTGAVDSCFCFGVQRRTEESMAFHTERLPDVCRSGTVRLAHEISKAWPEVPECTQPPINHATTMILSYYISCRTLRSSSRGSKSNGPCYITIPYFSCLPRESEAFRDAFNKALTETDGSTPLQGELLGSFARGASWSSDVDYIVHSDKYFEVSDP
jgi:hypothetical protein